MTPIINHNVESIINSSIGYSLLYKKLNNFTFDNVENVEINQANKIELKPYISYWSEGYKKKPNDSVINLHKLCVFYLKKHFKEVHFITDSESLPYFKDIKFTSVTTDFDSLLSEYGGGPWSLSKLYAYKLIAQKGLPFFHVDYDVILWEGLSDEIKKADVFAQNIEKKSYDWYEIKKFEKNCPNLYLAKNLKVKNGINVGVFGGKNIEFIYKYSDSALNLVLDPANKDFWLNYNGFYKNWVKATIAEQYYLAICQTYYNQEIKMIFPDGWPNQVEAENQSYTHIMRAKDLYPQINNLIAFIVNRLRL